MEPKLIGLKTNSNLYNSPSFRLNGTLTPANRSLSLLSLDSLPRRTRPPGGNLSSGSYKRKSWMLPESPTVTEKQKSLTRRRSILATLVAPPLPKVPHVEKYLILFPRLTNAYCDYLKAMESHCTNHQLQEKESHHLAKNERKTKERVQKIRDLNELYIHQEHMREGARNLLNTLEHERSKKLRDHIDECKGTYKKILSRLVAVEEEINGMAGSFRVQVTGLIGFARLSPGDTYEVQFKHNQQRWRSRCKIVSQGQKWLDPQLSFGLHMLDDMHIKVQELKTVNANNIGVVDFPIIDFISANTKEFTIPVNDARTMKLRVQVKWSPLSVKDEQLLKRKFGSEFAELRERSSQENTPKNCRRLDHASPIGTPFGTCSKSSTSGDPTTIETEGTSWIAYVDQPSIPSCSTAEVTVHQESAEIASHVHNNNLKAENTSETPRSRCPSIMQAMNSIPAPDYSPPPRIPHDSTPDKDITETTKSETSGKAKSMNNSSNVILLESLQERFKRQKLSDDSPIENTNYHIRDLLIQIAGILATLSGEEKPIIFKLEKQVKDLKRDLDNLSRRPSTTPSIESALESFDFLSEATSPDKTFPEKPFPDKPFPDVDGRNSLEEPLNRLPRRLHSTNWNIVKKVLHHHLLVSQSLLVLVNSSVGPLTIKESKRLLRLSRQYHIMETLIKLASTVDVHITARIVCPILSNSKQIDNLWNRCAVENPLYCTCDKLDKSLKDMYAEQFKEEEDDKMCQEVCSAMLGRIKWNNKEHPEIISVFEVCDFFGSNGRTNIVGVYFEETKRELLVRSTLESSDDLLILSMLRDPREIPITPSCLSYLAILFTNRNKTIQGLTGVALSRLSIDVKHEVIEIYMEMLEDTDPKVREGACLALGALEATDAKSKLMYVWSNDIPQVQQAALRGLQSIGFCEQRTVESPSLRFGLPEMTTQL